MSVRCISKIDPSVTSMLTILADVMLALLA